jgi:hypothetical protein
MGRAIAFGRALRAGLSRLRRLAASRLAPTGINPSRVPGFDDEFGPEYEAMLQRILDDVRPPQ